MNSAVLRQTAASLDILMTFKIICVVFVNALQAHRTMWSYGNAEQLRKPRTISKILAELGMGAHTGHQDLVISSALHCIYPDIYVYILFMSHLSLSFVTTSCIYLLVYSAFLLRNSVTLGYYFFWMACRKRMPGLGCFSICLIDWLTNGKVFLLTCLHVYRSFFQGSGFNGANRLSHLSFKHLLFLREYTSLTSSVLEYCCFSCL